MIKAANSKSIEEAAEFLRGGGLVGMPTETVYGLAANALDGDAVAKIFEAKGRPSFNPLIIHVPDIAAAGQYVEVNETAESLANSFWPGPLTMVLPRKKGGGISELASAGLDTLAIRVPAHAAALALLKASGLPLAAPSANSSGSLSPTTPAHVHDQLGASVDMILAAGACKVGLESTVIDLSAGVPEILRPGGVTAEQIADVLGTDIGYAESSDEDPKSKVKSPGMLLKHYAPNIPVRLNAVDVKDGEALLAFGATKFMVPKDFPEDCLRNLSEGQDLHEAAANLFAMLKDLDQSGAQAIAVMAIPQDGIGVAINDRLARAAKG